LLSSFLISAGSFVVLLSIVVIFHEYGHYKTGRLLGIGVERFAIGFGPALYTWTRDGVEFRLNMVPMGGYVKFVGDEPDQPVPPELRDSAFNTAPVYKRMLTVFAGPAMNLVLAFLLFCVIFIIGFPAAASVIGDVASDSPAERAGLQAGDRITAIDSKPVRTWQQLSMIIGESPNQTLALSVERAGQPVTLTATPDKVVAPHMIFMFDTERGSLGVSPFGLRPLVGVADFASPAYAAGLRTGDHVVSVGGKPIAFLSELAPAIAAAGSGPLTFEISRGEENIIQEMPPVTDTVNVPAPTDGAWTMASLGVESGELFVHQVAEGSPAAEAGIESGDRLAMLQGKPLKSWEQFTDAVRAKPGKGIMLGVVRGGQPFKLKVMPEKIEKLNLMGEMETYGQVGLSRLISLTPVIEDVERYWNPATIVTRGFQESWAWTVRIVQGLYYLIVGKVPASSIGGPIAIARLAGASAEGGLIQFLFFMAIISVNLAFINLVPVPIFDGGHLVLFAIEKVRGRPMGERGMAVALRIGVAVIGALFLLVFYNDFRWVFFKIKETMGI
jgi:regulator of sigma E protease